MLKKNPRVILAPSLLGADYLNMEHDIKEAIKHGAKWLHFDVMDGQFVDNLALGVGLFKKVRARFPEIFIDVHLMVGAPDKWTNKFAQLGANLVTFHHEALRYKAAKKLIKSLKLNYPKLHIGVAIKPKTNVEQIYEFLQDIDVVLVMSVEPGLGGQSYIDNSELKIKKIRDYINKNFLDCFVEVDGGINDRTVDRVVDAGVDVVVAGSYVFSGAGSIHKACNRIIHGDKKNSI